MYTVSLQLRDWLVYLWLLQISFSKGLHWTAVVGHSTAKAPFTMTYRQQQCTETLWYDKSCEIFIGWNTISVKNYVNITELHCDKYLSHNCQFQDSPHLHPILQQASPSPIDPNDTCSHLNFPNSTVTMGQWNLMGKTYHDINQSINQSEIFKVA